MKITLPWTSRGEVLTRYKDEINKENRIAIRLLALSGLPLSVVNAAAQWVIVGPGPALTCSYIMFVYFGAFLLFERFLLPKDYPRATMLLYLMESPVMLISVMLGTVTDREHQAVTILLFMIALPAFIMDRPRRLLLFISGWSALFLAICYAVKDRAIWATDTLHVVEFFFTSVALVNVILRVRSESLRHLQQEEYHLEHEQKTGCLNRYALASRAASYVGRNVVVLLADMDRFMMYNDFYGHESGQTIMDYFTRTLMDSFGQYNTYHYNGDEFLCVVRDEGLEACQKKIALCREKLDAFCLGTSKLPLTCTFGFTSGTPSGLKEFQQMIQLADINAHKAKKEGGGGILGDVFTEARFREGVVESNMMTHAPASEINQLTGLPGMSYFVSRSDVMLASLADLSRKPVVGCFKLIHMRDFNDTFGYEQGDALIRETSRLLQQNFTGRYVCHITAAQFGVVCYEGEVEDALCKINESLREYKPGFPMVGRAGFARYTGSESVISLLDKAKIALNSLSQDRDNFICYYDQEIDLELRFRQYIINHVDEAIEKGYLQVYYQPIARAVTGHVCNEEALSRWDDPHYGFLMPDRFIPTLEENGLMYKVNLFVVRQVLRDFRRRKELGVPVVPVSVNLSRKDFEKCDIVQEITDLVDASGFPREMLKIEITESAFIENQELLKRAVARFRKNGFEVWMDDFGSGYSTLNLLQELDFDLIKLDMQFMKNFSTGGKNYIIISDIIDMAKRMGITTLIEGVENLEHFQTLQSLGCGKVQGFLFNKPNPFDYIVQRALAHTGLTFEDPEAAPYYEAVGGVDLSEPLSHGWIESGPQMDSEVPAGVLELRDGKMSCLRGTPRFKQILEGDGVLLPSDSASKFRSLTDKLPEALVSATARCVETAGWVNFDGHSAMEGPLSIYLRRVSNVSYKGAVAILMVLLHSQEK